MDDIIFGMKKERIIITFLQKRKIMLNYGPWAKGNLIYNILNLWTRDKDTLN